MGEDGLSREETVKVEQRHSHLFEMAPLNMFLEQLLTLILKKCKVMIQSIHLNLLRRWNLKGKKRSNANASTTITTNIMVNFEPEPSQPLFFLQCFLD